MRPLKLIVLTLSLVLALAACDSAEERAERHFRSAEALAAAGDIDRALVELRNVFKLDGAHREARRRYAELQLGRGELEDAFGNYLRLVEFYPDDLDGRLAVAELAIAERNWEEAERHGRAADALAHEEARVRAVVAALDYRLAIANQDEGAREVAAQAARAALALEPAALSARMVVIDNLVMRGEARAALAEIDIALEQAPGRRDLHEMRLRLLVAEGDDPAVEAQLEAMFARFSDDTELRDALVVWHVERGRPERAEAFLRDLAAQRPGDSWPPLALIEVIRATRGADAARAEIDALLEAGGDALQLRTARATLDFSEGRAEAAIAELSDLVEGAEPSAARHDAEVALAQMLAAGGDAAAARARVGAVLAADAGHVAALKLEAVWLIEEDRPGDAILALRRALTQEPRDAAIMLLMAEAHLRDGSRELAGERLALAVEVSNRGVRESLRYATFLVQMGRHGPAEAVLEDARRVHPGDLTLLAALTELRIDRGDWDRAARGIAELRARGSAEAGRAADTLQAALLMKQNRAAETLAHLEGLLERGEGTLVTVAGILQTHLQNADAEAAEAYLDGLLARFPEEPTLRFLRASLHLMADETAEAEALYRALTEAQPGAEGPVRALYALLSQDGRPDEATEVLAAALAHNPGSVALRWMQAGEHEKAGDFEEAITLYEALYAENSANLIFANNLASLLTTRRADPESLERAFAIARRLRHSDVPAFRDTYGWIEHRRGNHAEALPHLQYAAGAMPGSALAQFHLGMTNAALGRGADAREALGQALALADGLTEAQVAAAEAELARLGNGSEAGQ